MPDLEGAPPLVTKDPDQPDRSGTLTCGPRFQFLPVNTDSPKCCKASSPAWNVTANAPSEEFRKMPMFLGPDSLRMETQEKYCEAACAATRECLGYSFSFHAGECVLCTSIPGGAPVAGEVCVSAYKVNLDTQAPCEAEECFIETDHPVADASVRSPGGQQCAEPSEDNPDSRPEFMLPEGGETDPVQSGEFEGSRFLDLCVLEMIHKMMHNEKWQYKCAGVELTRSPDGLLPMVKCIFADRWTTPDGYIDGTEATSANKILKPMCPISMDDGNPSATDKSMPGKTFCRDRTTVPMEMPIEPETQTLGEAQSVTALVAEGTPTQRIFIPFDCGNVFPKGSSVPSVGAGGGMHPPSCNPGDLDDNGYLKEKCCSSPLYLTQDVLTWFEQNKEYVLFFL
uniref:Uncharacterized protein n=1 Tax=Chromera velia CCMP2878 TaxID=1169474 RepID=A0A0G4HG09_9ALVE|eukprot:Cvel_6719.t1-p1 / transcript=Cvel_6719.t1 / gene=Cvel_6719 / organism=Chromera_velia_CCMP2878 / gene_product=hypothetical protein / transcript_product=hypothetical protein / location=Cvel_scaffold335:90204-92689(-) / protein_length=396 / sequence_SO=supercontig / SO=protein_coding / is_pseudo=false